MVVVVVVVGVGCVVCVAVVVGAGVRWILLEIWRLVSAIGVSVLMEQLDAARAYAAPHAVVENHIAGSVVE